MERTLSCTACGGPNEPEEGAAQMACTYCGALLTIPVHLRTKAKPQVNIPREQAKPAIDLEQDAAKILRKAQPAAVKAWNLYAYFTWLRWLAPACLTIFVIGFFVCLALGALPFVFQFLR